MLRGLREVPGPEFGVYAVNHLLLPMLQGWLRRASKTYRGWDGFANNFKQCCGLATELVVEYLGELSALGALTQVRGLMLMVHQLFLVLAECIAQPVEVVSRLGCACIRHLLVSGGPSLSPDLWRVAASSVWRATRATLLAAQQLMVCFPRWLGELLRRRRARPRWPSDGTAPARRPTASGQLCRQVFLLDAQRATLNVASCRVENAPTAVDQECSFIFLLHPPDKDPVPATSPHPSSYVVRVPFQQLVVGLLSHQILLQTLATLLLESTRFRLPALASVLACPASPARSKQQPGQYRLAGQLEVIPMEQLRSLLAVLEESYGTATDFDERPGLKFLVQKVARCEVAANLFKQAAISWAIQAVVLLELCLGRPAAQPLTMDAVNRLVASSGRTRGDVGKARRTFSSGWKRRRRVDRPSSSEDGEDEAKAPIDSFEEDKCQWRKRRRRRLRREQRISESLSIRRAKSSLNEASGEDWNPYRRLRSLFADLCAHYARVASPEAKEGAILDRVCDQPIFFLMAQPDTLPEILPDRRISRADSAGSAAGSEPAPRHPVPLLPTDSSSDSSEPEMAAASESALQPDRVYSIVTERAIQSMVSEYKRRKTRHSMPAPVPMAPPSTAALRHQRSSVSSVASKKSSLSKGASLGSDEGAAAADNAGTSPPPLPTEDAEAHVQVWSQLAQSVLELHLSLCEAEFLALVPVFYAGVEVLVNCGPAEPELRALTADWLHRVALGLGFSGSLVSSGTLQQRL
ncbi:hypothetical protein MTO96_024967 [Rhipicephalus appendiculatus]